MPSQAEATTQSREVKSRKDIFILSVLAGAVAAIALLSSVALPHAVQLAFGSLAVVLMATLLMARRRISKQSSISLGLTIAILTLGGFLTIRYLLWRFEYTINFHDLPSLFAALLLLLAEIYGIVLYLIGCTINAKPKHRVSPPFDASNAPTVDVLIPTYNEETSILEVTLLAATQLDYPAEKLKVWLLDDGGTDDKRYSTDLDTSQQANERHLELQALCKKVGANYLTRPDNREAKAGNLNAALPRIHGELVVVLDADHVPSSSFLSKTVGFFQKNDNLFLVQTPHRFVNPDPIEKNLETYRQMPGESEMFYRAVQPGLDAWHSAFFCGSAAVLRRSCLDELGGLSCETVTEDAETSICLHALGYESVYYDEPLVLGLQPETFDSFIGQRSRWAQGMVQIFIKKNPLFLPGLSAGQRLGYLSSTLYWFFSYARLIFLLAPCAYLLFNLKIYDASLTQFLVYACPHLIGTLITTNVLYGRFRWAMVSELYESVQSCFSSMAITRAIANPNAPRFFVTAKGHRLDDNFISPLYRPLYLLLGVLLFSLLTGLWKYVYYPEQRDVIYITGTWAIINITLLAAGLGVLLEKRQRRNYPRVSIAGDVQGWLDTGNQQLPVRLLDISMSGCQLAMERPAPASDKMLNTKNIPPTGSPVAFEKPPPHAEQMLVLQLPVKLLGRKASFPVRVVPKGTQPDRLRLAFGPCDLEDHRNIVALGFGNSENLRWGIDRKNTQPAGILRGLGYFIWLSTRYGFAHVWFRVQQLFKFLLNSRPFSSKPFTSNKENNNFTEQSQ